LFVEFPFEPLCSMLFSLSPRPCQFILLVCFRSCVLSCFLGLYICIYLVIQVWLLLQA
jgi:hypothetical protein